MVYYTNWFYEINSEVPVRGALELPEKAGGRDLLASLCPIDGVGRVWPPQSALSAAQGHFTLQISPGAWGSPSRARQHVQGTLAAALPKSGAAATA